MDIGAWLRDLGLQQYEQAFRENAVDVATLPDLTESDLEKLGVLLGHRKRMLAAIARLMPGSASGEVSASARPAGGAELRPLTVLFCDMVGSTALSSRLGLEDLREVLGSYNACVAEVAGQFGGSVIRYMGDGILVCFGYPRANENDAEQAILTGLGLIDRVGQLDVGASRLEIRVGIASGLVVAGDLIGTGEAQERGVIGETPNLAARLQTLAQPNTLLIDDSTRRLVGDLFEYRDLGAREVRGLPTKVPVWQVLRISAIDSRFEALRTSDLTPLVGRSRELELLLTRWEQAKVGEGQVVLLTGEAGIGKSRITVAFEERMRGERRFRLRYFCSLHHRDSSLYPFISHIERAAGFTRDDSGEEKLNKLEALLLQTQQRLDEVVPLFADLLALPIGSRYRPSTLDPRRRREMIFATLIDQLEALTQQRPVQLIVEDAHWMDSTSLELMQIVVERLTRWPVLLVMTFRPEFEPSWIGQAHVSTLTLSRLGLREAAAMVEEVAGGRALPHEIVDSVIERTDGIPLFIEELTKTLIEGDLLRTQDGRYVLTDRLPPQVIPSSLHASLMARLDRLNSVKDVAQTGAAIGREFSYELLRSVATIQDNRLRDALDQLTDAGLVFRRGVLPRAVFIFKHALVQDAAYNTLLRGQRQELHARIGKTLEMLFPETVATQPEILAHHYTQAGLLDEAIHYWHRAGERALRRSANIEAATHLNRGIQLTRSLPPGPERDRRELGLYLSLGPTMRAIKGHGGHELLEVYSRARDLLTDDASVREQMNVLYGLWIIHFSRSEHAAAHALAQDCLARSMRHQHTDFPALAHSLMGNSLWATGEFLEAKSHLDQSLALCASEHLSTTASRHAHNHSVAALSFLSFTLWPLGYPEQAAAAAAGAVARASGTGHVPLMAMALHNQAFLVAAFAADPQLIGCEPSGAVDYCVEHSVAAYEHWARFSAGAVLARTGELVHGMEIMQDAMEAAQEISANIFRSVQLGHLAAAYGRLGRPEIGVDLLQEAIGIVDNTDERFFEAELHRFRGEILIALGKADDAEAALQRAMAVARIQDARLWELRAAASLARLWSDQGRKADARWLLAPVYDWFTEGLATADLKTARLLLEELGEVA